MMTEQRNYESWLSEVGKNGSLLKKVPEDLITREMCEAALKDEGNGLPFIPESFFDKELAWLAIENTPDEDSIYLLKEIPERLRDQDICSAAVRKLGHNIAYVPDEMKTLEMCRYAVETHSSFLLQYIPERLKSEELEELLVDVVSKRGATAIRYIPRYLLTEKICIAAIKYEGPNGKAPEIVYEILKDIMTEDIAMTVARYSPWSLGMIPEKYLTEEMLLVGIEKASIVARYVPERLQSPQLLSKMMEINPMLRRDLEREGWFDPWRKNDSATQTEKDDGYTIANGTLTKSKYRIVGNAVIPEGVASIGPRAFLFWGPVINPFTLQHEWNGITKITFPSSLRSIGDVAFGTCPELEEVAFPEGLETISSCVFRDSINLTCIWIPSSTKNIESDAFNFGMLGEKRLEKLTIYAPEGSYAQQFAEESGFPFIPCDRKSFPLKSKQ